MYSLDVSDAFIKIMLSMNVQEKFWLI